MTSQPKSEAKPPDGGSNDPPRWSVMIPTCERDRFLSECLESVLAADPGEAAMEIVVIDNASENPRIARIVAEVGLGRIGLQRSSKRVPAIANWNRCVAQAKGEWLHILHDDDKVAADFYAAIGRMAEDRPEATALATQVVFINADGTSLGTPSGPVGAPQRIELEQMLGGNPFQCAGVVMRREFAQSSGGYDEELAFHSDWEMWMRAAEKGAVWFDPDPHAFYRLHEVNYTKGLERSAGALEDLLRFKRRLEDRYHRKGVPAFQAFCELFLRNQIYKAAHSSLRAALRRLGFAPSLLPARHVLALSLWLPWIWLRVRLKQLLVQDRASD